MTAFDIIVNLFVTISYRLVIACFAVSFCFYVGWIKRGLWFWAEYEFSRILNGTPVTLGSLEYDLIRGKVRGTNVVIHQPGRDEWKWDSPLLARIGTVEVEVNVLGMLMGMLLHWELPGESQKTGIDLYSIVVSDVQGFIERRDYVFNFYLCDATLDLPDPKTLEKSEEEEESDEQHENFASVYSESDENDEASTTDEETKEQAQKIVHEMFSAVNSLSRAAQRKGGLKGALMKQKRKITSKLKELQTNRSGVDAIVESSKVIRHVGSAVGSAVVKTQSQGMPSVPKKENLEEEPPVFVRVGRINLKGLRIFTKDSFVEGENWNKPIVIDEVSIRSAELCPPMSLVDDQNLPVVYQPIDRLIDVVLRRVYTEMAKSNTGRLFKTAMSEVLGIMKSSSATRPRRNSNIEDEVSSAST